LGQVWHFSEETFNNCQHLIEAFGLSSWSAAEWNEVIRGGLFSNVVVTSDNFSNVPHCDPDISSMTYGIFSYIEKPRGHLIVPPAGVSGHAFWFPKNMAFQCN
jgi:hypothetical protein